MSDDWFRSTDWDETISRRFEEKLARTRRKEVYLRIQAATLAETHPTVALELLDRYFELPDDFDHALAYVNRATAMKTLGRIDEAIKSYEAALTREAVFPNVLTQVYLDLPILIATENLEMRYDQALKLLDEHEHRLTFPIDNFLWHSAYALIMAGRDAHEDAVNHANSALEAASRKESGFRYHPSVGLVTDKYDELVQKLTELVFSSY
jgi:tetratricopeptide (TPR) repeat protein